MRPLRRLISKERTEALYNALLPGKGQSSGFAACSIGPDLEIAEMNLLQGSNRSRFIRATRLGPSGAHSHFESIELQRKGRQREP